MAKKQESKPAPAKKGSLLLPGILVGMVLGVGIAAAFAWFIAQPPNPFINKSESPGKPIELSPVKPSGTPAAVSPEAAQEQVRSYEFYKVLTEKNDNPVVVSPHAVETKPSPARVESKPAPPTFSPKLIQVAAFSRADDAEKHKAALAFHGLSARVEVGQSANGPIYRVRLGPYRNAGELSRVQSVLKQNGVDFTLITAR